ncbi:spore protease YyaC [Paenibacillus anaericanus]|uniref:Spore protease YyaC n=1 Tax=Paenibacillus anaericanus TaxID=170367 RepID=A0A3S1EEG6_9BACL|nr:spore protease YyaC [Paenibacillus anaericanus]RUT43901.1 spore protease YyaC [Paenibacillus anaericanus]
MGVETSKDKALPFSDQEVRKISGSELVSFFQEILNRHGKQDITFLCIGTDRSTGDALGPLVGSRLEECGWGSVIGSLRQPCDANNLEVRLAEIPKGNIIVAMDACLGSTASVGCYLVSGKPLLPAQSVRGDLPAVGHYSIAGVVNLKGPKPYSTLQMTSLYSVMLMADEIVRAAAKVFMPDCQGITGNKQD